VKFIRLFPLVLIVVAAPALSGQASARQPVAQALALERDGRPAQAIVALLALLDSKSLDALGTGEAWNILGLSYRDQGNFAYAQHAFEQSIRILEGLPNNTREYGMALDTFGGLMSAIGQPEPAGRMRKKAIHVYEKTNYHSGIAIASSNLAGLAFSQKQMRQGRIYLERARQEAQLASDLDDDNLAAIFSMQGWMALLDGDVVATILAYQHSLDLWRKKHGEEHPSTGWGYILLGNAKAEGGDLTSALVDMQRGMDVLDRTLGQQNTRYLTAEIAYSRVLDRTGAHTEAARMKTDAERELKDLHRTQCVACTVSAAAFR
jgi:tetratricopeptide (TPR) repeat protein